MRLDYVQRVFVGLYHCAKLGWNPRSNSDNVQARTIKETRHIVQLIQWNVTSQRRNEEYKTAAAAAALSHRVASYHSFFPAASNDCTRPLSCMP